MLCILLGILRVVDRYQFKRSSCNKVASWSDVTIPLCSPAITQEATETDIRHLHQHSPTTSPITASRMRVLMMSECPRLVFWPLPSTDRWSLTTDRPSVDPSWRSGHRRVDRDRCSCLRARRQCERGGPPAVAVLPAMTVIRQRTPDSGQDSSRSDKQSRTGLTASGAPAEPGDPTRPCAEPPSTGTVAL